MDTSKMREEINHHRRRLVGAGRNRYRCCPIRIHGFGQRRGGAAAVKPGTNTSFGPLKQIDAGVLNVGYAEAGPADGAPVILLHGWPYDIYSYVDVGAAARRGRLPRDHPLPARLWHDALSCADTMRNGQPSAIAVDIIAFHGRAQDRTVDPRRLRWGARTANIMAALWPQRVKAMVSVSGYLDRQPGSRQAAVAAEGRARMVVPVYFATERGRAG